MIYAVRLGMADETSFSSNISALENQLSYLEGKQNKIIEENWKGLKAQGRK